MPWLRSVVWMLWSTTASVFSGARTLRPAQAQAFERLRARHFVDEVAVDVDERRPVGAGLDDVVVPDLVVHRARLGHESLLRPLHAGAASRPGRGEPSRLFERKKKEGGRLSAWPQEIQTGRVLRRAEDRLLERGGGLARQHAVEDEMGEAVNQRPGGDRRRRNLRPGGRVGARADAAGQRREGGVGGGPQLRVVAPRGEQRREHQPEHAGLGEGEIDIGRAHRRQRLGGARSAAASAAPNSWKPSTASAASSASLSLEMAIGRGRRNADPARRFAQADRVGAALVEQRPRGGDQGGAQRAVVIGGAIRS